MKNILYTLLAGAALLAACTHNDAEAESGKYDASPKNEGNGNGTQPSSGLVTAGEWNDLDHWNFFHKTLAQKDFADFPQQWKLFTNHRIAVLLTTKEKPVVNATVALFRNDYLLWTAKTDNFGKAELWVGAFQKEENINTSLLRLKVNDSWITLQQPLSETSLNRIALSQPTTPPQNELQLAFMVDATGSMGDELEFLKKDLQKVIADVQQNNASLKISTATVFYRDEGDEYVVKESPFTQDLNSTLDFIGQQRAEGGGDFPEAVDQALERLNQLQWNAQARTRLAFLLLDAPPHEKEAVLKSLQASVKAAAAQGVKLIPIVASGIDKSTEFLMRFIAIQTNGTYVFITNHSGIGNPHLPPSVGEYQVEKLVDLMSRLIKKYATLEE